MFNIRPARPDDALGVARVHVRSWQAAYRTLLPDEYLDSLRPEDRAARYTLGDPDPLRPATLVAAHAEAVYGFATTAPAQGESEVLGELSALYVDPDWWGKGLGVALITAARQQLVSRGFRTAVLWILAGNTRAARFYNLDGWSADGGARTVAIWGITADELRYRRDL